MEEGVKWWQRCVFLSLRLFPLTSEADLVPFFSLKLFFVLLDTTEAVATLLAHGAFDVSAGGNGRERAC
jgi:hypothetical protein